MESYDDDAVGYLDKNLEGKMCMTRVVMRPLVRFISGTEAGVPDGEQLAMLHERAHRACFIANSVKTSVEIEPREQGEN